MGNRVEFGYTADQMRAYAQLVAEECANEYERHLADYRVGAQLINARAAILSKFGAPSEQQ
jgi:hypothetical protein